MKTFYLETMGCQMNEHDSQTIREKLKQDEYVETTDIATADVIIYNTCTIRDNADKKLYGKLGNHKNTNQKLVVTGCLAQKDQQKIREKSAHVNLVIGTHNLHLIDHYLKNNNYETIIWNELNEEDRNFPSALPKKNDAHSSWITIQIGCDQKCSYCIVPAVRGAEKSREFGDILKDAKKQLNQGATELILLGQNVDTYGRDITKTLRKQKPDQLDNWLAGETWANNEKRRLRSLFNDLLEETASLKGLKRLMFTSPHPNYITHETLDIMAKHKTLNEYLHFPLQSGSDKILKEMHRGYTQQRYLEKLTYAKQIMPNISVSTDIIVGYPTETEEDFEKTLDVCEQIKFDNAYTFIFSPREGTPAAELKELDKKTVGARFQKLLTITEKTMEQGMLKQVGKIQEIKIEGPSKKGTSWAGRTQHNRLVHFEKHEGLKKGDYANALITEGHDRWLRGELQEITHKTKKRTLIPLTTI